MVAPHRHLPWPFKGPWPTDLDTLQNCWVRMNWVFTSGDLSYLLCTEMVAQYCSTSSRKHSTQIIPFQYQEVYTAREQLHIQQHRHQHTTCSAERCLAYVWECVDGSPTVHTFG
eukprot:GHUV01037753.1.p2 GENE.GHUV01037753.1~~GHUV01037753.1.p2  ORF type:complete len:114 (+),score=8.83 GHUV01037753.1:307-648(+)